MGDEIGSRSESKSKVVEKRSSAQFGGKLERCKQVKMRDLDSVCRSEEMAQSNSSLLSVDKDKCNEPLNTATVFLDTAQTEVVSKMLPPVVEPGILSFGLNSEVCLPNNSATMSHDVILDKSNGFSWDLNIDDKSGSPNEDPFFPFKNREHLKSVDVSECGSTTGPLEDKDPMRVWKEMKQNGFLSSSHVSITVPKQRGRKSQSEGPKKKMELAKKEQVDRFAKIAAPSGLLNELNPGIINHVRNKKQVHSIIEALVRLERDENRQGGVVKHAVSTRNCDKDDHVSGLRMNQLGVSHDGLPSTLSMSQRMGGSLHLGHDQSGRDGNTSKVDRWVSDKSSIPLPKKQDRDDDVLALKLASSTKASENMSNLSNDESANMGNVSSLSVKGATVALHWLELLQQDIKGRLVALRRSKNRVRSVISTELPFLISREFSSSTDGCSISGNVDAHQAKWGALFDQMDKNLYEEEKQLEIWLHQVKEMQLQCENGLQFQPHPVHGSQHPGTSETDHRLEEVEKTERELAIRAAAASIYSTCNFLSSSENLHCS